ncbi:MAG TPA: hypothetical protein VNM92_09695 [Thermoanaerobaculia bacterium]|nr:hypothetical protein [Thermoanaerobaculia bacterium]
MNPRPKRWPTTIFSVRDRVPDSTFVGERARTVFSKIMALLLGAIGVQLVLNGIKPLIIDIVKAG